MNSQNPVFDGVPPQRAPLQSALYNRLIENSSDLISIVDENGVYQMVNSSYLERYEKTEEEIVGLCAAELLGSDAFENTIRPNLVRCLSGEQVNFQDWFTHPKLGERYMDVHYYPLPDGDGPPCHVAVVASDITAHKKAEDALRESEGRYRLLAENIKDVIWVLNLETMRYSYVSPSVTLLRGFSVEEVMAERVEDSLTPASYKIAIKKMAQELSPENIEIGAMAKFYTLELEEIRKDGSVVPTEETVTLIRDEQGRPTDMLGVTRDITERKRMLEEFRLSEERYRRILDASHDMIIVLDADAKMLFANRAWSDAASYTFDELNEINILESIHPDDRDTVKEHFLQAVSGVSARNVAYRSLAKDGKPRWFETNADPIDWPGVDRAIVITSREVTRHKQAEQALRESEEKCRVAMETAQDAIFMFDENCDYLSVNRMAAKAMGKPPEEMIGKNLRDFFPEEVANRQMRAVLSVFQRGEPLIDFEAPTQTARGERWYSTSLTPVRNDEGKIAAVVGISRDITERRRMEEELKLSMERYHGIIEASQDMIIVLDTTGRLLFANEAWHRESSWTVADWNEARMFDSILEADREKVMASFYRAMEGHAVRELEYRAITTGGEIKWITANASRINWTGAENVIIVTARDTTKRKVAEQALEESLSLLGATLDATADGILAVNMEGDITSFNEKFSEIFKIPESILLSRKDCVAVEYVIDQMKDPDAFLSAVKKTYERSDEEVFDILEFKDGRILEHRAKPQKVGGQIVGKVLSFRDITMRTRQDQTIRKRNERIAALYEVAKAASETLDFERLIDQMQKVILKVTNSPYIGIYSLDENTETLNYIGHRGLTEEFVAATSSVKLSEGLQGKAIFERKPIIIQDVRTHTGINRATPKGPEDPNSVIIVPLIARDEALGTLLVGRDIGNPFSPDDFDLIVGMASQVAAAMNNASLYSQLRERETRLQTILETSRDGIALLSSDRTVMYRNSAMAAMFGYDEKDDLTGLGTENFISPESWSILEDIRRQLSRGEEVTESIQFKGLKKGGDAFDVELRLGNFFEGDKRYGVAVVRDVTEQKKLLFQLEQSGKLAAIGELAAGVAHEINNPIAILDVRTGLMRDVLGDERRNIDAPILELIEEYLDIVENQVHRCQSVTDNLLSFSRSPESRKESFAVNELLEKAVGFVAGLTDKRPRVELKLDERLPHFIGDPGRLEQVFVNLLNNAMKAIAPQGAVTISTRPGPDGDINIEIKDTGPGIDPETRACIFDPFFTTESASGGTGLGLSISYYIIKEMGGTIDVESSLGEGATFTVTLPGRGDTQRGADHA